jgi:carboxylesterase type B
MSLVYIRETQRAYTHITRTRLHLLTSLSTMWSMKLLSALCFIRSVHTWSYEADGSPIVGVRNGTIIGTHSDVYDQDFFLGIPFAQSPVNGLRFRNPQSLNTTYPNGLYQASEHAPACIGYGAGESDLPLSEDCLYLNVIRPSGYEDVSLPVGLWIHGGGFTTGGCRMPGYNLSYIVQNSVRIGKPIIGVSIAYRLSGWGFLASQQVSGQGQTNIALRDQRLAMHWTKENICAFGGDPEKVTIWGESAVEYSFVVICCPRN